MLLLIAVIEMLNTAAVKKSSKRFAPLKTLPKPHRKFDIPSCIFHKECDKTNHKTLFVTRNSSGKLILLNYAMFREHQDKKPDISKLLDEAGYDPSEKGYYLEEFLNVLITHDSIDSEYASSLMEKLNNSATQENTSSSVSSQPPKKRKRDDHEVDAETNLAPTHEKSKEMTSSEHREKETKEREDMDVEAVDISVAQDNQGESSLSKTSHEPPFTHGEPPIKRRKQTSKTTSVGNASLEVSTSDITQPDVATNPQLSLKDLWAKIEDYVKLGKEQTEKEIEQWRNRYEQAEGSKKETETQQKEIEELKEQLKEKQKECDKLKLHLAKSKLVMDEHQSNERLLKQELSLYKDRITTLEETTKKLQDFINNTLKMQEDAH